MYYMCNDTLCNITIDEQDVLGIISVLSVNKAIGPDCISHKMLKSTIFTIVKHLLCYLIDLCQKRFFHLFGN